MLESYSYNRGESATHARHFRHINLRQKTPGRRVHARASGSPSHALADIVEERLATKQDIDTLRRDMKEMEISLKGDMKELETSLKRDMKELETSLKRDIKELETSLHRDMKDMEYRLTIRLGAMLAVSITIIGALIKLL